MSIKRLKTKKPHGLNRNIEYTRRLDLENENLHIVIIDVKCAVSIRIISLYRSFRPQDGIMPEAFFKAQIEVLKRALTKNCFIMGDFNLDIEMEHRTDYVYNIILSISPH